MFEQATATYDQHHRGFFNTSDEPRQVWAFDSTRRQIVYLPDDAVNDSFREACRHGRLRCPIADCPDPRLIAKGGTKRRHHFAHKVAHTRHDSAAVFRTEAIAMLAAWARRYRGAQISTRHEGTLGIVTIRSAATGNSTELAVTYDPRHEPTPTTRRQLLVGHTRALLLPRGEHPQLPGAWLCGDPRLVGHLIADQGAALAINPERQLVATVLTTPTAARIGLAPTPTSGHPTLCLTCQIDDCSLDAHGTITTPALRTLRTWEQRHGPASRLRRPRPKHAAHTRSTPAPADFPIDVDELPPALNVDPLARHTDINRVVLSGQISDDGERLILSVNDTRGGTPRSQIVVKPPRGWTAPANSQAAVVLGRLATDPRDLRMTIIADAIET
ncbi:MAG: hypothetical protein M3N47_10805 [Chloroflexota bacterium]|nr:hypothetical protein [Chloroflexota bacterium]